MARTLLIDLVMNKTTTRTFKAIDPTTGCHLRDATEAEVAVYLAQPSRFPDHPSQIVRESFFQAVRVGDVLVDEWTGYGVNYDQGVAS